MAAIGNFRVLGTTATQALIAYTAPDGNACTIQLSQNAGLTPLALDVDPGTFANSNSDLIRPSTVTSGLSRTVLLGQRTAQYATAGTHSGVRHFSRALQAYTPYFGKITCPSTGDTADFTFTTGNIPLGHDIRRPLAIRCRASRRSALAGGRWRPDSRIVYRPSDGRPPAAPRDCGAIISATGA